MNGGVQGGPVGVLTERFGTGLAGATPLAFVAQLMTFVVVVAAGLMPAGREGFKWPRRRRIRREVSM